MRTLYGRSRRSAKLPILTACADSPRSDRDSVRLEAGDLSEPEVANAFLGRVLATLAEHCAACSASFWDYEKSTGTLRLRSCYGQLAGSEGTNEDWQQPSQSLKVDRFWREIINKGQPTIFSLTQGRTLLLIPIADERGPQGLIGLSGAKARAKGWGRIETTHLLAQQAILAWKLTRLMDCMLHSAVSEERARIARDLHDTLAQAFTSILIQVDLADEILSENRKGARRQIQRTRQLASNGLVEARRAVLGLRPCIESTCLLEALQHLTDEFNSVGSGVRAKLRCHGSAPTVPPEIHAHLFRIAQEALTNVLKHAHATRVRIELSAGARSLRLAIVDDGCGFKFPANEEGPGWGLKGIKERARLLGGCLSVRTKPSQGTQVSVSLPILRLESTPKPTRTLPSPARTSA